MNAPAGASAAAAQEGRPATPAWRGLIHQAAFFVAIPAGVTMIAVARGTSARVAAIVYAISLVGMYGVSAAYHRLVRSETRRRWLKRIDHSMIYVLIAGTTTPVALLGLRPPWSPILLVVVWGGASVGIAMKLLRIERFRAVSAALYIVVGWAAILFAPQLIRGLNLGSLILVLAGGVLYTCGAIVLLRNRPNPSPATFGYHEVWHAMVVAASACHYVAVLLLVLPARTPIG